MGRPAKRDADGNIIPPRKYVRKAAVQPVEVKEEDTLTTAEFLEQVAPEVEEAIQEAPQSPVEAPTNPFSLDELVPASFKSTPPVEAPINQKKLDEEAAIKESTERAWKKALARAEAEKDKLIRWRRLGRW